MNVADCLRQAADTVDRGWCQNHAAIGNSRCATQAIYDAMEKDPLMWWSRLPTLSGPIKTLMRFLNEQTIISWNDTPGRTRKEVSQAMRDAALMWEIENGIEHQAPAEPVSVGVIVSCG